MSSTRVGDYMILSGDRRFYPFDPRRGEIRIEDIAHALANLCRFGGRVSEFYSVAQHSVLVAEFVARKAPDLAIYGLLHDAAEAYLGDIITPVKRRLRVVLRDCDWYEFHEAEAKLLESIHAALGVPPFESVASHELAGIVDEADELALATEARDLLDGARWDGLVACDPHPVEPVAPGAARRSFLAMFEKCMQAVKS